MTVSYSLVAWNAQGFNVRGRSALARSSASTWQVLGSHYMRPLWDDTSDATGPFLLAGLTEAGKPPSFSLGPKSKTVKKATRRGSFTGSSKFKLNYNWYGWSKGGKNLRCSLCALQAVPSPAVTGYPTRSVTAKPMANAIRPPLIGAYSGAQTLIVALVHLNSGASFRSNNFRALSNLANALEAMGRPAIIMGDINIDIGGEATSDVLDDFAAKKGTVTNWDVLRTDASTQISGGELDWALAYNCANTTAMQLGPLSSAATPYGRGLGYVARGVSDHAVVAYTLDA
ncbi:MAG: hypothetical protein AAF441_18165 [Pseudomonadota bacterium]